MPTSRSTRITCCSYKRRSDLFERAKISKSHKRRRVGTHQPGRGVPGSSRSVRSSFAFAQQGYRNRRRKNSKLPEPISLSSILWWRKAQESQETTYEKVPAIDTDYVRRNVYSRGVFSIFRDPQWGCGKSGQRIPGDRVWNY
jgi:hypothetical protein